jgi:photosystem II stability/assembly factor-like uncharacterized protein
MNRLTLPFVLVIGLFYSSCQPASEKKIDQTITLAPIAFPSHASFRGIHGLNNQVWLAGSNSEVWVYNTQSSVFTQVSPFENSEIQFRDVEVLGEDTAIIVTAGFPAMLLKTNDGGISWDTVLQDTNSLAFFDGIDFQNKLSGVVFGDPIDQVLQVYTTNNGGNSWTAVSHEVLPKMNATEAGFAASGSSILMQNNQVYIGLGGEQARVFKATTEGWLASNTPLSQGTGSKGIYSLDFMNQHGIAVGGQYDQPADDSTRAYTSDSGVTWQLGQGVDEYRSSVVMISETTAIACGPSGIDISNDSGATWTKVSTQGLHALYWPKNSLTGYGCGADGVFYKITLSH